MVTAFIGATPLKSCGMHGNLTFDKLRDLKVWGVILLCHVFDTTLWTVRFDPLPDGGLGSPFQQIAAAPFSARKLA